MNYSLFPRRQIASRDENGHTLKFESSRERQYRKLKIFIPDADNSTHTISIEYVVSDALRFFDDHDEFYWNITGDDWHIPIESASAHIVLPAGASNIRANVFTGAYRSPVRDATAEIAGTGVDVRTNGPLGIHEGLTVAIAFDKGAVQRTHCASTLSSSTFAATGLSSFLSLPSSLMFWLWWTQGRDPRLRPIAAQYEPPDQTHSRRSWHPHR